MGPLTGIRVVEFAALGPAPMATMLLADLGADVVRIERANQHIGALFDPKLDILNRNRRVITLDLKSQDGLNTALEFITQADALIEGFRPGVMERLGLGPAVCLEKNPKLVYGRMTGWGQHGALSHAAGHDINYLSLSGALHAIGEHGGKPVVPLNLVADCGGGAMFLAFGVLAALLDAKRTGQGQVVDAAMTDGCATLMTMMHTLMAMQQWQPMRGSNLLDGGAHFYDTYRCADGEYVAVGAIEPQFYALLLQKLGIDDPDFEQQWHRDAWPRLKEKMAAVFLQKTRDEWWEIFQGTDACVSPVLNTAEAVQNSHNQSRGTFVSVNGVAQAAPAPRFSQYPQLPLPQPPAPPQPWQSILADWQQHHD